MSIKVVFGRRGYGKSTWIRHYLKTVQQRYIIFDTLGEYSDCGEIVTTSAQLVDTAEKKQAGYFQLVFQPYDENTDDACNNFLRTCWILSKCRCVIDEIDLVSSPVSVPDELAKNIRYGRHRDLELIAAARRANNVPRDLTSQADDLILFNQREPNDIKYLESYIGKDGATAVMGLSPHYFLLVNGEGEIDGPRTLDINESKTEDSEDGEIDEQTDSEENSLCPPPGGVETAN